MAYDWEKDEAGRYWNHHHERMRKLGEEQRAQEEAERNKPPQTLEPEPAPQPSKVGKFVRRVLAIIVFMGGPSVAAFVYGDSMWDNSATQSVGDNWAGGGVAGLMFTVLAIVITAYATFD